MGHCRDCKHWGDVKHAGIYGQDGMKDCPRLQEARYVDIDGEPCTTSTIGTAPDFGCVLFEPALRGIFIEELQPGEQPVAYQPVCIVGVKKSDGPPPLTIATAEEYRAYFNCDPPPDWFQPVTVVIPIADAPEPPWPTPYPEKIEPGAMLLEDAIDRSDWGKP